MAQAQKTKYAILGALTVYPMSGYDIKKWIKNITGGFWAESSGRVYPVLSELLHKKLITCNTTSTNEKRNKKVYKITPKGKKILKKWLAVAANETVTRDELRLKLFYGKNLTKSQCLQHLARQKQLMQQELLQHQNLKKHILSEHKNEPDSYFWLLTLTGAFYHIKAELAWCKTITRKLKKDLRS